MYTLINTSRTLCCGVFKTVNDAELWNEKHTAQLNLSPVELLLDAHTRSVIEEFEGFTAEPRISFTEAKSSTMLVN